MNRFASIAWIIAAVALCLGSISAAELKPAREFTITDPTKVKILDDSALEKNPEIDHFRRLCPSFGGYQVIHEGCDLGIWLNVRLDGKVAGLYNDTLAASHSLIAPGDSRG